MIIRSYDNGIDPSVIATQIKKTAGSISTFYCRYIQSQFLPPKEIMSKRKIDVRLGLSIKKIVQETPKLGVRKFKFKLKEKLPDGSW
jgi:hypothetical protein